MSGAWPSHAEIGLIGLGVMGQNLALNIADHGFRIAVYNRTPARTEAFAASEEAGHLSVSPASASRTWWRPFCAAAGDRADGQGGRGDR